MVCLDTSFLIDVLRGNPIAKNLVESLDSQSESKLIASPSIVELISGAILNPKVKGEKDKVINFLSSFSIINLDKPSAVISGEIEADLIKQGNSIEIEDIMIGAIALTNKQTLLTKNTKHFQRIKNLKIESY